MLSSVDPLGIVGTTVSDKYDVERCVEEGGFSIIYRAKHRIWHQPVALKCFKSWTHLGPEKREALLEDFIREGALLTSLSRRSATIVQARDVGTFTTARGAWVPYLVLEWLEGSSLENILVVQRGAAGPGASWAPPWSQRQVMRVLEPVAAALDLVHRQGIVHRDVKPANIFIVGALDADDMQVKVLDFGIAKVVSSASSALPVPTRADLASFTPRYGAPEQFSRLHGDTGPWTDVYALALVFSELIAGKAALDGDEFIQFGISTADPVHRPTPRALGADISDELEAVCRKALAVRPADRFVNAGEFWDAVRGAIDLPPMTRAGNARPNAPAPSPASPALPTAPRSSNLPKAIAIAATLTALAIGSAWKLGTRPARPDVPAVASAPLLPVAPSAIAPPSACPPQMVEIAGGKFFMGDDEGSEDERPVHQVILSPYCIDLREVTVADYDQCVRSGACKPPSSLVDWQDISPKEKKIWSALCNESVAGRETHPINCVSWEAASVFCASHAARLPTEAEWEFAARGPDGRKYPWGDEEPDSTRLNACGKECVEWGAQHGLLVKSLYADDDGYVGTAPVGSFPRGASPFGLLDIVGNVWEWTSDWEGPYQASPITDPAGPQTGKRRVVRGGAYNGAYAAWVRPTRRYSDRPETLSHAYGFRCARSK